MCVHMHTATLDTEKKNQEAKFAPQLLIWLGFGGLAFTCLCSPNESISDRTQPTLPSPPHTKIRKVENF